jgi:hypothetical protein
MSPAGLHRRSSVERRAPDAVVVLVRDGAEVAAWPFARPGQLDVGVADELARLQLAAQRLGCSIQLRDACEELIGLLELVGLGGVVIEVPLPVEVLGKPEVGEELGVDEVVVADDPVA